jgi:SAM-dependent methyltransferase
LILEVTLANFDSEDETIEEVEVLMKSSQIKSNKSSNEYLMESEDENIRLEIKTDPEALRKQALWCGVKPGMRILDAGCGPGITTTLLHEMIQPGGCAIGIDYSEQRISYAKDNYANKENIEFYLHDLRDSMEKFGQFDLIWVRFVLEYHRKGAFDIVKNLKKCIKPGGVLCLLDLDYNCLSNYEMPPQIANILPKIMNYMDEKYNFDTFIGRKLYSFLYDAGFEKIEIELMPHNLIYGEIKDKDKFNWIKKIKIATKLAGELINSYPGGYEKFISDLELFINNPRRFMYAPLFLCKGIKLISN